MFKELMFKEETRSPNAACGIYCDQQILTILRVLDGFITG